MEPEQLRDCLPVQNLTTTRFVEEKPRDCQESPTPAPPPVMDMMDTILEWEEEEGDSWSATGSNPLNLTSPLANTSYRFESPAAIIIHLLHLSPMGCSHPLPPVNTPSTGQGQAALLNSCRQQLVVSQAAVKLAAVTGPTQQKTSGLQLLRDSLAGLFSEQQLQQEEEDLIRTAAAFIQFVRSRGEGEEMDRLFREKKVKIENNM